MSVIKNPAPVVVTMPPARLYPGAFRTSLTPVTAKLTVQTFASPDDSWSLVSAALNETDSSFFLYIYQITDDAFCDEVARLWEHLGKDSTRFKVLLSRYIYDPTDYHNAQLCYKSLYSRYVPLYLTAQSTKAVPAFNYCHQKFWILDDDEVWLSSGNWGSSDFPFPQYFPPYGRSGWMRANRDHNVRIWNADVAAIFKQVLTEDLARGSKYSPGLLELR
jgi:hypothetical protein